MSILSSCLLCTDITENNDINHEMNLDNNIRYNRPSISLSPHSEETLRELLKPDASLPIDNNEEKDSNITLRHNSCQRRRSSDPQSRHVQLNRVSVDISTDHPLSSNDNNMNRSNLQINPTTQQRNGQKNKRSFRSKIKNIASTISKNSNVFTEAFSSSLKDIVVRGAPFNTRRLQIEHQRQNQLQRQVPVFYSDDIHHTNDINFDLNHRSDSMEVELKNLSLSMDVIVDEFEIDSDMETMKFSHFHSQNFMSPGSQISGIRPHMSEERNNIQRQRNNGQMYLYYYQEVIGDNTQIDRLSEYSTISSVSSPVSVGLASSVSGSLHEFESTTNFQSRSDNFHIFQQNLFYNNNHSNNYRNTVTHHQSNNDGLDESLLQTDRQVLTTSDSQYRTDSININNQIGTRSPTPRRRLLLRRRLIPTILQNPRLPEASIDPHLFQLYRVQPFAAVGFLRGLIYTGMGSLLFQIYVLYYWPQLNANNASISQTNTIFFERISFIWVLCQLVLQLFQCPMRYMIHQNLITVSGATDAEEANQSLRNIMSSRVWWCNQWCGIVMRIFGSFGLILYWGAEYLITGESKEVLSNHILSICCLNLLAFIIRVLLTIGLFYSIQVTRRFSQPIEKIGLTLDQISQLKKLAFSRLLEEKKNENINSTCCICLCPFEENDLVIPLPCDIRHIFCSNCIEQWLIRNNSCPLCQRSIQF